MRSAWILLVASALAAFAAGCEPNFYALSTPPPFTEAELCDGDESCGGSEKIVVTKGIALAFECESWDHYPCQNAKALADDSTILAVYDGYIDTLSPVEGEGAGAQPRTAFVVVGAEIGETTLLITSDSGSQRFNVRVDPY